MIHQVHPKGLRMQSFDAPLDSAPVADVVTSLIMTVGFLALTLCATVILI